VAVLAQVALGVMVALAAAAMAQILPLLLLAALELMVKDLTVATALRWVMRAVVVVVLVLLELRV